MSMRKCRSCWLLVALSRGSWTPSICGYLWQFLLLGYCFSVLIEAPILLLGLSLAPLLFSPSLRGLVADRVYLSHRGACTAAVHRHPRTPGALSGRGGDVRSGGRMRPVLGGLRHARSGGDGRWDAISLPSRWPTSPRSAAANCCATGTCWENTDIRGRLRRGLRQRQEVCRRTEPGWPMAAAHRARKGAVRVSGGASSSRRKALLGPRRPERDFSIATYVHPETITAPHSPRACRPCRA